MARLFTAGACGSQGGTFSLIPVVLRVFTTPGAVLPFQFASGRTLFGSFGLFGSGATMGGSVLIANDAYLLLGHFVFLPYFDGFG